MADRVLLVGLGGLAVHAEGVQAGVTGDLGGQHQVFAAANQLGIESGVLGDGGDNRMVFPDEDEYDFDLA